MNLHMPQYMQINSWDRRGNILHTMYISHCNTETCQNPINYATDLSIPGKSKRRTLQNRLDSGPNSTQIQLDLHSRSYNYKSICYYRKSNDNAYPIHTVLCSVSNTRIRNTRMYLKYDCNIAFCICI